MSQGLHGRRILLVEDESLIAMLTEDMLADAGCIVLAALRLDEALRFVDEPIDLAVLDVNLGGGDTSFPVATRLRARGVPFLFTTGYGRHGVPEEFASAQVLGKPVDARELVRQLASLVGTSA